MTLPRVRTPEHPARRAARRAVLAVTFIFVLGAVTVSSGLVVHAARLHDLENGPFAIALAVLSARAALSWFRWLYSSQPSAISRRQDREERKPEDETPR